MVFYWYHINDLEYLKQRSPYCRYFTEFCRFWSITFKGKKAEHLYSALHGIQTTLKRSGMDHTVLPATNTMPALPRKRSPDGASTD